MMVGFSPARGVVGPHEYRTGALEERDREGPL